MQISSCLLLHQTFSFAEQGLPYGQWLGLRFHCRSTGSNCWSGTKIHPAWATQWWPERFAKQGQNAFLPIIFVFCFGKLFL